MTRQNCAGMWPEAKSRPGEMCVIDCYRRGGVWEGAAPIIDIFDLTLELVHFEVTFGSLNQQIFHDSIYSAHYNIYQYSNSCFLFSFIFKIYLFILFFFNTIFVSSQRAPNIYSC